jgi:UrcA family protein
MKAFKRVRFAAAAAALVVALGAPAIGSAAFEGNIAEESDINVNYNDLDLSEDKGVNALYQRLQWAATRVCGSTDPQRIKSTDGADAAGMRRPLFYYSGKIFS